MTWELIGSSDVDSGQIAIVDPCYVMTSKRYKEFLKHAYEDNDYKSFATIIKGCAQGMVVQSGQGDGTYNVYVKRSKHGIVTEAKIVFVDSKDVPSLDRMLDKWEKEAKLKRDEKYAYIKNVLRSTA